MYDLLSSDYIDIYHVQAMNWVGYPSQHYWELSHAVKGEHNSFIMWAIYVTHCYQQLCIHQRVTDHI